MKDSDLYRAALSSFRLEGRFSAENSLTTSLTIAVEAMVSGQDDEVKDSLQSAITIKKLSFIEFLPPPALSIPDRPQPLFGISAGPPGYDGSSLIRVETIFNGYLNTLLSSGQRYLLYRLPAGQLLTDGWAVRFAKDPAYGNQYRRDFQALKSALDIAKGQTQNYLGVQSIQQAFRDFAEKVEAEALDKDTFLRLPVVLPGETNAVFLFAIRAYETKSRKESPHFTCLSPPIYVEDVTRPAAPILRAAEIVADKNKNEIALEFQAARRLNPVDGYGYVAPAYLDSHPELCAGAFPYFIADYRLYLSNERDVVANPDDSDFYPVTHLGIPVISHGAHPHLISLKLMPGVLALSESADAVTLTAQVRFTSAIKVEDMSARMYYCLRAGNYLGQWSPLALVPGVLREIIS